MNYRELLERNKDTLVLKLAIAEFVSSFIQKDSPDFQCLCELCYETYLKIESLYLEEAVKLVVKAYHDGLGFDLMTDTRKLYDMYSEILFSE